MFMLILFLEYDIALLSKEGYPSFEKDTLPIFSRYFYRDKSGFIEH